MDNIGRRLREERQLRGWSQRDLAREAGVNTDTISGIETGDHEPRPSTLRKLAEGLGIEVRDLFAEPALPKDEAPREAGRFAEEEINRLETLHDLREHIAYMTNRFRSALANPPGALSDWALLERDAGFAVCGAASILLDLRAGSKETEAETQAWASAARALEGLNAACDEIEAKTDAKRATAEGRPALVSYLDTKRRQAS